MQQYFIIILISTNLILIIKYHMFRKKITQHNYYLNIFEQNCLLILNFLDSLIFYFILVPKTFKSP